MSTLAQSLDVIERTLLRKEDVDNYIDIIEENPLRFLTAFDGAGIEAEFSFDLYLDFIGDGLYLAVVGGGGDEEIVGQSGVYGVESKDACVFAFLVFAGGDGDQELLESFRVWHGLLASPEAHEAAHISW